MRPLAIDLYSGLGGWAEGFLAEGYEVVGFDVERHDYGTGGYPGQLVLQDVLTLHGSQFRDAACIVASPPCQEYSYMGMPWSRAKQIARALEGEGEFPEGYTGSRTVADLNALFDACFRIQREASEAAGHYIPLIVENVNGAQRWVGPAKWHYGSYYLWGDVPALMPFSRSHAKVPGQDWNRFKETGEVSPWWRMEALKTTDAVKTVGHVNKRDGHSHTRHLTNQRESDAVKNGNDWFGSGINCSLQRRASSNSSSRRAASAAIAKIPLPLAQWIAQCYMPEGRGCAAEREQQA